MDPDNPDSKVTTTTNQRNSGVALLGNWNLYYWMGISLMNTYGLLIERRIDNYVSFCDLNDLEIKVLSSIKTVPCVSSNKIN